MNKGISFGIGTLVTWALWVAGVTGFTLIALNAMPERFVGLALAMFATGTVLYIRGLVRHFDDERETFRWGFEAGRVCEEARALRAVR